jgi:hypothetical protein
MTTRREDAITLELKSELAEMCWDLAHSITGLRQTLERLEALLLLLAANEA